MRERRRFLKNAGCVCDLCRLAEDKTTSSSMDTEKSKTLRESKVRKVCRETLTVRLKRMLLSLTDRLSHCLPHTPLGLIPVYPAFNEASYTTILRSHHQPPPAPSKTTMTLSPLPFDSSL